MRAAWHVHVAVQGYVLEVGSACRALATDLDALPFAVTATDPVDAADAWCAEAEARIAARLGPSGWVDFAAQPATCSLPPPAEQAACETTCAGKQECEAELENLGGRCFPEDLVVRCDGSCFDRCDGSANVTVACNGYCEGACTGSCDDAPSDGACDGRCEGSCRGSCDLLNQDSVSCVGECAVCDGAALAARCKGPLAHARVDCSGTHECHQACRVSAAARAQCLEPAVAVVGSGGVDRSTVAALELHLPRLLRLADARGPLLEEAIDEAPSGPWVRIASSTDHPHTYPCMTQMTLRVGLARDAAERAVPAVQRVVGAVR